MRWKEWHSKYILAWYLHMSYNIVCGLYLGVVCSSFPAAQTQVVHYLLHSCVYYQCGEVIGTLVEAPLLSYLVTSVHLRKRHTNMFPQHRRLKSSSARYILEAETLSKYSHALKLRRSKVFSKLLIFQLRFFSGWTANDKTRRCTCS